MAIDDDLVAYYDAEARAGLRSRSRLIRADLRRRASERFRHAGVAAVIDIGAGPGVDAVSWRDDGFNVVGLDLSVRKRNSDASGWSPGGHRVAVRLAVPSAVFDAAWTMSTLVHVPDSRLDLALDEIVRVVRRPGHLGIGTWGGSDYEGTPEFGDLRPYRFFALRSHDLWRAVLERIGVIERFDTFAPDASSGWEYQFAIVRVG